MKRIFALVLALLLCLITLSASEQADKVIRRSEERRVGKEC